MLSSMLGNDTCQEATPKVHKHVSYVLISQLSHSSRPARMRARLGCPSRPALLLPLATLLLCLLRPLVATGPWLGSQGQQQQHRRNGVRSLRFSEQSTSSLGSQGAAASSSQEGAVDGLSQPLHPSKCPEGCTTYGTCHEELGRCDCPLGFSGPDCSTPERNSTSALCAKYGHTSSTCSKVDIQSCINACNFRGKCIAGFCHCRPGFYGTDCALSLDARGKPEILAGQSYKPRASGPRIYIYELPPAINTWYNVERLDRPLMYQLWQRLLSAGLRVADPREADLFFVPVRARLAYDSAKVKDAVSYIRAAWPFWNETGGEKHIFVHTGDWGRDELWDDVQLLTRNCTWLTHWGLARDHDFAGWKGSHRPGRDIVIPLFLQQALLSSYRMTRSPLHPAAQRAAEQRPRRRTLFFAGRVCGSRASPTTNGTWPVCPEVLGREDAYSAATRQRTFYHHHNRTNWRVVTHTRSYAADVLQSKFCLAPTGGGQGKRSITTVLMGCVPVTVTDGLMQPFEPEMHWDEFAVDIRERDIPVLHEILEGLTPGQVSEFQSKLRCAAQHLFWSSLYGSVFGEDGRYDAFETLVQVLRMRVKYPSVGPEEYSYVDPEFDAFMRCDLPAAAGGGQQQQAGDDAGSSNAFTVADGSGSSSRRANQQAGPVIVAAASAASAPLTLARPQGTAGQSGGGAVDGSSSGGRGLLQELCSHSELETPAPSCNKCTRRRGRLLNPGGTICCNSKELAKCPRLWD